MKRKSGQCLVLTGDSDTGWVRTPFMANRPQSTARGSLASHKKHGSQEGTSDAANQITKRLVHSGDGACKTV
jgi:hypothetical protein